MALFENLFISRKNQNNNQDYVSDKLFTFGKDQVRIMLFRECDFKGRKVLFDSDVVKRVPLDFASRAELTDEFKKMSEDHCSYGYKYPKLHPESTQFLEMIFGTVALSFCGTYFKIHNLSSPQRLMFSQVFPSPRQLNRRISISSQVCSHLFTQSSEHSSKLHDSGLGSTDSTSEQLSVYSLESGALLVCRRQQTSFPLEVKAKQASSLSNFGDSGCGDNSSNSYNSELDSLPTWSAVCSNTGAFSQSSSYKKWLRNTSTSLDHSDSSLTESSSAGEVLLKPNHKSKLGFALLIEIRPDEEPNLIPFFMEHVALIESFLWRSRKKVELAHRQPQNFLSLMSNITESCTDWLINLLSGPYMTSNLWLSLSFSCDNNSIGAFSRGQLEHSISSCVPEMMNSSRSSFTYPYNCTGLTKLEERSFFNLSSFSRSDKFNTDRKNMDTEERSLLVKNFIRDFCELLDIFDVKATNFFISTLLTTLLAHHLGWVATSLPSNKSQNDINMHVPFNALWGQLTDLFGAVGFPTKMAQTVIVSSDKKDIMNKILNTLTYFIRCCDVERRLVRRANINEENHLADIICQDSSCIPLEFYKSYEDHLKEMMGCSSIHSERSSNSYEAKKLISDKAFPNTFQQSLTSKAQDLCHGFSSKRLPKTKTYEMNISSLSEKSISYSYKTEDNSVVDDSYSQIESSNNDYNTRKYPSSPIDKGGGNLSSEEFIESADMKLESASGSSSSRNLNECNKNVVFFLGDDDELVGLRKQKKSLACRENESDTPVRNKLKRISRSKTLTEMNTIEKASLDDLIEKKIPKRQTFEDSKLTDADFRDEDFILNEVPYHKMKSSASCTVLNSKIDKNKHSEIETNVSSTLSDHTSRSQSVPPEKKKEEKQDVMKSKYRYSGYKFTLQQYPQILENYLKSKNLEISSFQFDKKCGFKQFFLDKDSNYTSEEKSDDEEIETLQTPSNASEMESATDLLIDEPRILHARESSIEPTLHYVPSKIPVGVSDNGENKTSLEELSILDSDKTEKNDLLIPHKMKIINFPMPRSVVTKNFEEIKPMSYTSSLIRNYLVSYIPDMVLQGITSPKPEWEDNLKNSLVLSSQHSLLDQRVEEAVAIVANLNTWEVQLMSSKTYLIDKRLSVIRVGMSQSVASMLESLLHMWKLKTSPNFCSMHIEQKLKELCIRSKALAQLLLDTDFCTMEYLTSTLHLEVNDVPLLMAIASTHSPQATQKYGLSLT